MYASWLQNNKRDVMVARSQDFGGTWYLSAAASGRDDADKPVLTVHGADVYVGFNHEQKFWWRLPRLRPDFCLGGGESLARRRAGRWPAGLRLIPQATFTFRGRPTGGRNRAAARLVST